MTTIQDLDTQFFLWLNSFNSPKFDGIMAWISAKNSWIPLYILIIATIFYFFKKKGLFYILSLIVAVALSDQFASSLLKPLFKRLRPCHEPALQNLIHLVGNCGGQFGFCSSHAANSFALATLLNLFGGKQWKALPIMYVWAFVVSYSRIYVGVHYPIDVLVGAFVGIFFANIVYLFTRKYFKKFL
jgi:undecaprenyl-diphosphatase